jgi:Zn-dependent alcohol dehydrogenase
LITTAALFRAPGTPIDVCAVAIEPPGPDDVLIRMQAVGICGSDLHVYVGEWTRPTPMILGHEGAGVVEAVGDSIEHLVPGDPVLVSWAPSCGVCATCASGQRTACPKLRGAISAGTLLDGTTRLSVAGETVYRMTTVGALAEHVVVPGQCALPLPKGLAPEVAALLGCAALTGVGAVRNAGHVSPGSTVVVIGAGGVGQFVVQAARIAGAKEILVVDPHESRRDAALALGATRALSPDEYSASISELLGDGADYAFEVVGSARTISTALTSIRSGGKVVLVGMPPTGTRVEVDPFEFIARQKTLTGSMYGSEEPVQALPDLLNSARSGDLELASLVGPAFPLSEVNEAFKASLAGSAGRVIVTP